MKIFIKLHKTDKVCHSLGIANSKDHGVGSEVNPESWTQLKGSNEKGI